MVADVSGLAMKKILMLSHDDEIDRRVIQQAETLARNNLDVLILSLSDKQFEAHSGIKVMNIAGSGSQTDLVHKAYKYVRSLLGKNEFIFSLFRAMALRYLTGPDKHFINLFKDIVLDFKPDIVVAHDLPMLAPACVLAKKYNAKIIYDSHELFVEQGFFKIEKKVWQKIEEKYINDVNHVITINQSIADELARRYQLENIAVVSNAYPYRKTKSGETQKINRFGKADIKHWIIFQGGLIKKRNLKLLIQSFVFVDKDIGLVILGDGYLKEKLKKFAARLGLKDRIVFIDAVLQNELIDMTSAADVGIIPYSANCLNNYYCTPNKLFEFIMAGIPIIAFDLPEIKKVLETYQCGMIIKSQEPKAIGFEINDLFRTGKWAALQQGVIHAREQMTWESQEKELVSVYQQVC